MSNKNLFESAYSDRVDVGLPNAVGRDLDTLINVPDRPKILIVDDEPDTVSLLKLILRQAGYDVFGALSCSEALSKCSSSDPDVILLDLMMPDIDGWETYDNLRKVTDAPVMIISALSGKEFVVRGLEVGADDYLPKPFVNAEVVARVQNIVRRQAEQKRSSKGLYFPEIHLKIELETQSVVKQDKTIYLSGREFEVLELLARQAPEVVTYRVIAEKVWGENNEEAHKRIKYLIFLLRQKLEDDPTNPGLIVTASRVGYRLEINKK